MTTDKKQKIEAQTPAGIPIEITLEQWVSTVIEAALRRHKCPFADQRIINRIESLELKLKIIQWVGAVVCIAVIGQVVVAVAR